MLNKWTGNVVGKMHTYNITQQELAERVGVSRQYLNMILNGKKNPKDAQERFKTALDQLIAERGIERR